jgi:hypothetical protein
MTLQRSTSFLRFKVLSTTGVWRQTMAMVFLLTVLSSLVTVASAALTGSVSRNNQNKAEACSAAKSAASTEAEINRQQEKMGTKGDFDVKIEGCDCSEDSNHFWTCSADWGLKGR